MTSPESGKSRPDSNGTALNTDTHILAHAEYGEADDPYMANLARMAARAAREPGVYEIAGATVQHVADQIQAAGGEA